ncbi:hypothetical protein [Ehrlichia ruminantium]|uniref:hypothetical protein n=1 Tax=Ehrlichia ruminantium TaxID=779 RepID=UPI00130E8CD0|nr:hypothetical protein [Ehrlichia ruminantium]
MVDKGQASSTLEDVYIKQGARPKRRGQHGTVILKQETQQPSSALEKIDVKQSAKSKREKIKLSSQESKHIKSTGPLGKKSNFYVGAITHNKTYGVPFPSTCVGQLTYYVDKLTLTPTEHVDDLQESMVSGKYSSKFANIPGQIPGQILARLQNLHFSYLCELLGELFIVEHNILSMNKVYYDVLSGITSHANMAVSLLKLNICSQLAFALNVSAVGNAMLLTCLNSMDFYVIDRICIEAHEILQKCKSNAECRISMLSIFTCYLDCQNDGIDNYTSYSSSFYAASIELLNHLISAKLCRKTSYPPVVLDMIDLLIVSCGIQLGLVCRNVDLYYETKRYYCARFDKLRNTGLVAFMYKLSEVFQFKCYVTSLLYDYGLVDLGGMKYPGILLSVSSPNFASRWCQLVEQNCEKFSYIIQSISNNIICHANVENMCNLYLVVKEYELVCAASTSYPGAGNGNELLCYEEKEVKDHKKQEYTR